MDGIHVIMKLYRIALHYSRLGAVSLRHTPQKEYGTELVKSVSGRSVVQ